jgi:cyclopropane-fatty-acyl-phospholipid synthase
MPVVRLHSWRALVRLISSGSVGWYKAWALGEWSSPDPVPLVRSVHAQRREPRRSRARKGRLARRQPRSPTCCAQQQGAGAANIAFHYDLGNDFYRAWLDPSMTYSSALFAPGEPLEAAQERKIRALLDRLELKPGQRLLEIGCGWGSLAEIAARDYGVQVTASPCRPSRRPGRRADARGGLVRPGQIELTDYRDVRGEFDAVASVEMVEAVGQDYWPAYLQTIARVLKPGGRAALQLISIREELFDAYAASADFIQTYIFPGGMLISEPRFQALAELAGLSWRDRAASASIMPRR